VTYLLGGADDAEDVVQDSFLYAFERIHKLRNPAAFKSWLQRIAVGRARNFLRRKRLTRALGLDRSADDATLEALADKDMGPEQHAELALIDDVLREVPADARIAWILRYVEGQTLDDIALALDCSLSTVKRRIRATHTRVLEVVNLEEDDHG
jgi:RNA polymerase sigma-70 factor (ECF subfamily)